MEVKKRKPAYLSACVARDTVPSDRFIICGSSVGMRGEMKWELSKLTVFTSPKRLDMICFLSLAMALHNRTRKLLIIWEHYLLPYTFPRQAFIYNCCDRCRSRILALLNILARRLRECPDNRLGGRSNRVRNRVYAIAINWYYDEVMLTLGFLWEGKTEYLLFKDAPISFACLIPNIC